MRKIITIGREFGAGGGEIGKRLSKELGIPFYDKDIILKTAMANRKLNPGVDTVFLMTSAEYMYLSSSIVKDIAAHGGDITGFVPDSIQDDILLRIRKEGNSWQR